MALSKLIACVCGAGECEVHRVACPVWMSKPEMQGTLECPDCKGTFNSLKNGLCGVCSYWKEKNK